MFMYIFKFFFSFVHFFLYGFSLFFIFLTIDKTLIIQFGKDSSGSQNYSWKVLFHIGSVSETLFPTLYINKLIQCVHRPGIVVMTHPGIVVMTPYIYVDTKSSNVAKKQPKMMVKHSPISFLVHHILYNAWQKVNTNGLELVFYASPIRPKMKDLVMVFAR